MFLVVENLCNFLTNALMSSGISTLFLEQGRFWGGQRINSAKVQGEKGLTHTYATAVAVH